MKIKVTEETKVVDLIEEVEEKVLNSKSIENVVDINKQKVVENINCIDIIDEENSVYDESHLCK